MKPTLAEFLRHAELYGTEQVYETAEQYLAGSELVQLDRELTRIHGERRKRFEKAPQRKGMSQERKAKMVAYLTKEDLPDTRIAGQMGITTRQVRRLRSKSRRTDAERADARTSSEGSDTTANPTNTSSETVRAGNLHTARICATPR